MNDAAGVYALPDRIEQCRSVLITQRSQVQILPGYQKWQVKGLIVRTAVRPSGWMAAPWQQDRTLQTGRQRVRLAEIGIADVRQSRAWGWPLGVSRDSGTSSLNLAHAAVLPLRFARILIVSGWVVAWVFRPITTPTYS